MDSIIYQDGSYTLGKRDGLAWLDVDGTVLRLTSQPYEPCTYISRADGGVTTIHNAFDTSVVLELFADGRTLSSITGRTYYPGDFCGMIWHTVNKWGPQEVQIDAAERSYIEVLKDAPLQFPPIGQDSIRLEKAKTLAEGVTIGELPLDLIRYIYVIRLQGQAKTTASCAITTISATGIRWKAISPLNGNRWNGPTTKPLLQSTSFAAALPEPGAASGRKTL